MGNSANLERELKESKESCGTSREVIFFELDAGPNGRCAEEVAEVLVYLTLLYRTLGKND